MFTFIANRPIYHYGKADGPETPSSSKATTVMTFEMYPLNKLGLFRSGHLSG